MGDNHADQDKSKGLESPLTIEIPPRKDRHSKVNGVPARRLSISPTSTAQDQAPRLSSSDVHKGFVPLQSHDGYSSWSASSDKQLGSPGTTSDRVFPIRSVVSVDTTQTPSVIQPRNSGEHDYFPNGMVAAGAAGIEIAGAPRDRKRSGGQPASETENKPTPARTKKQQESRTSQERSGTDRKPSLSTTYSESGRFGGGSRMQLFNDAGSERSNAEDSVNASGRATSASSVNGADQDSISGLVTARFKHIVTAEGHAVITGRDGETLQRCEDEP